MPAGRPPYFNSKEELEKAVDDYFNNIPEKKIVTKTSTVKIPVPTITGLARHLGFVSRQSFYDYEKNDKYSYIIKRARLAIEQHYEELLQAGGGAGAIFALKNFGWKDRTEVDNTQKVIVEWDEPE